MQSKDQLECQGAWCGCSCRKSHWCLSLVLTPRGVFWLASCYQGISQGALDVRTARWPIRAYVNKLLNISSSRGSKAQPNLLKFRSIFAISYTKAIPCEDGNALAIECNADHPTSFFFLISFPCVLTGLLPLESKLYAVIKCSPLELLYPCER